MPFTIQRISDQGTENPIVARVSAQSNSLLDHYTLSQEQRENLHTLIFENIQRKMLLCDGIAKEVTGKINAVQALLDETGGLPSQSNNQAIEVPYVIDLENQIDTFLYNAKSCLKSILGLFSVFLGKYFSEARYDKAYRWAAREFGEEDPIYLVLKENHDQWVKKVVIKRNAIEHPDPNSYILHTDNFKLIQHPETNESSLLEPLWGINDDPKSSIKQDLGIIVGNMLILFETLFLLSLQKIEDLHPLIFREIPESERDPSCPIRYRMGLLNED